jgi:hypothetical protein
VAPVAGIGAFALFMAGPLSGPPTRLARTVMQEHANRKADRNPANFWHVATLGGIAPAEAPNRIDPPGRAGGQSLNSGVGRAACAKRDRAGPWHAVLLSQDCR